MYPRKWLRISNIQLIRRSSVDCGMFVLPKLNLEIELPKKLDVEKTASVGEMMFEYLIQGQGVKFSHFSSTESFRSKLERSFMDRSKHLDVFSMFGSYHESLKTQPARKIQLPSWLGARKRQADIAESCIQWQCKPIQQIVSRFWNRIQSEWFVADAAGRVKAETNGYKPRLRNGKKIESPGTRRDLDSQRR